MKLRNVQKTGNMHYVYLPTKWCNKHSVGVGSRVEVDEDSSGNLVISSKQSKDDGTDLVLEFDEDNTNILAKLIMSCFLNPVRSFEIKTKKKLDKEQLFHQRRLINSTLIEMEDNKIYSEPLIATGSPLSLLFIMSHKVKHLIKMMLEGADKDLMERYEDEVDSGNMMINKAVIASFMHKRESKRKLVELHYIGKLSSYLERLTDHLVNIEKVDQKEKTFLRAVHQILDELSKIIKMTQEDMDNFAPDSITGYALMVGNLKYDENEIRDTLISTQLKHCTEVLMDWAVTSVVDR